MAELSVPEPAEEKKKNIFDSGIVLDPGRFTELYSAAAAWSAVTQNRAADYVVMNRGWNIDFSLGVLSFGGDGFPMQVIGSESDETNSWTWAWASEIAGNPSVLSLANGMYGFGKENGIDAFTEPQFERTHIYNGYTIAAVAAMLCEARSCFYRCPYQGGAVFVTFSRLPENVFMPVNIHVFTATVMRLAQQAAADHKIMTEALLYFGGIRYAWEGETLAARFGSKVLRIRFDEYHRVVGMASS